MQVGSRRCGSPADAQDFDARRRDLMVSVSGVEEYIRVLSSKGRGSWDVILVSSSEMVK